MMEAEGGSLETREVLRTIDLRGEAENLDLPVRSYIAERYSRDLAVLESKCLVLGEPGVGKSSLISTFVNKQLTIHTRPTLGVVPKKIRVLAFGYPFHVTLLDAAGSLRRNPRLFGDFGKICSVILVFDLAKPMSLAALIEWYWDVVHEGAETAGRAPKILIVGMKQGSETPAQFIDTVLDANKLADMINAECHCVTLSESDDIEQLFLRVGALTIGEAVVRQNKEELQELWEAYRPRSPPRTPARIAVNAVRSIGDRMREAFNRVTGCHRYQECDVCNDQEWREFR